MKTTRLSIQVPSTWVPKLKAIARHELISVTAVIRRILEKSLQDEERRAVLDRQFLNGMRKVKP